MEKRIAMFKKQIIKLMNLPLNDYGNAERLKEMFGTRWVYLPRYKCWMYWDRYSWKGKATIEFRRAAAKAFLLLAKEIRCLPPAKDNYEQLHRTKVLEWLEASQFEARLKAVNAIFRGMCMDEQAVK